MRKQPRLVMDELQRARQALDKPGHDTARVAQRAMQAAVRAIFDLIQERDGERLLVRAHAKETAQVTGPRAFFDEG